MHFVHKYTMNWYWTQLKKHRHNFDALPLRHSSSKVYFNHIYIDNAQGNAVEMGIGVMVKDLFCKHKG